MSDVANSRQTLYFDMFKTLCLKSNLIPHGRFVALNAKSVAVFPSKPIFEPNFTYGLTLYVLYENELGGVKHDFLSADMNFGSDSLIGTSELFAVVGFNIKYLKAYAVFISLAPTFNVYLIGFFQTSSAVVSAVSVYGLPNAISHQSIRQAFAAIPPSWQSTYGKNTVAGTLTQLPVLQSIYVCWMAYTELSFMSGCPLPLKLIVYAVSHDIYKLTSAVKYINEPTFTGLPAESIQVLKFYTPGKSATSILVPTLLAYAICCVLNCPSM